MKKKMFARVKDSEFEGNNYIGSFSHVYSSKMGHMTYIGSKCSILYTKIGRYCSIASEVRIIAGSHPLHGWVSTHPSFYSPNCSCGMSFVKDFKYQEYKYIDSEKRYMVDIENDVWIGTGAMITDGVVIGNGSIVLAGAVVTKSVPPYSIVGGVPAKVIGHRFEDEDIAALEQFKWWDRSYEWLREHAFAFSDITLFKTLLSSQNAADK